ncbi:protein of unknown function [Paraburkholderia dioscoreae]|uniref:Uncharacterized protein n=1 Tax=Paraburkholderia dioscoreae TaxID=2604047 RepID=A0A5Q4Z2C7_9BURK|nr:protein of unknown function [Paraburkholderia dioscoreae]
MAALCGLQNDLPDGTLSGRVACRALLDERTAQYGDCGSAFELVKKVDRACCEHAE